MTIQASVRPARGGSGGGLRLGFAVNAPGIQERRAYALAAALGEQVVDVLIAPRPEEVWRRARGWDVAYVIDPGRVGFPAAVAAKVAGAVTLVEMGDPQRELYVGQDRSLAEQMIGGALDQLVAVGADGVVVRGRELGRILHLRCPWAFIPDGVDLSRFRRLDAGRLRASLGIPPEALVCGVVGTITWSEQMQFTYGLDLVEAVAREPASLVHVLVVGDGSGVEVLARKAAELGVTDRVHLPGRVAHETVPEYLNAIDVCVSTQTSDAVGRGRTTAKLPEYLACDRWVLSSPVGSAAEILPDEMLVSTDVSDWSGYVAEIALRLGALEKRLTSVRDQAGTREIAKRHFSYDELARRVNTFAQHCLDRRGG